MALIRKLGWRHYYLVLGALTIVVLMLVPGRRAPATEPASKIADYGYMETLVEGKRVALPLRHTDVKAEVVGVICLGPGDPAVPQPLPETDRGGLRLPAPAPRRDPCHDDADRNRRSAAWIRKRAEARANTSRRSARARPRASSSRSAATSSRSRSRTSCPATRSRSSSATSRISSPGRPLRVRLPDGGRPPLRGRRRGDRVAPGSGWAKDTIGSATPRGSRRCSSPGLRPDTTSRSAPAQRRGQGPGDQGR